MIGLFQSWGIFVRTSLEIPIALPPQSVISCTLAPLCLPAACLVYHPP